MHAFPCFWFTRSWCTGCLALVSLAVLLSLCSPGLAEERITLLDGEEASGEVTTIFPDGAIAGRDLPEGLSLDSVLQISREVEIEQREFRGVAAFLAAQGGVLSADDLNLADDFCTLEGTVAGEIRVKVERLGSLLLAEGAPAEVFLRAQETPLRLSDLVFLNTPEGPRSIDVLVESIAEETITVSISGESREVDRTRIYGIVFAERDREQSDALCNVQFACGDELAGSIVQMQDGQLTLQTPFDTGLQLPYSEVASIEIDSPRHMYLSDLEPLSVEESTLLSLPAPWQRDRSVDGQPLRLGARQYTHGLGVHAASRLTFAVERQFETFQAVVGIDAETEGNGDCEVVVYADDEELFRQRVRGGEPPVTIRLELRSPRRITLAVEPGEGYDLADHVSWCDVRLLNLKDE